MHRLRARRNSERRLRKMPSADISRKALRKQSQLRVEREQSEIRFQTFSEAGDKILVADWFWAPYNTIAREIGRSVETFELFDDKRKFNIKNFSAKADSLLEKQERLVIILNTPAHNPTGYALSDEDWRNVVNYFSSVYKGKKNNASCGYCIYRLCGRRGKIQKLPSDYRGSTGECTCCYRTQPFKSIYTLRHAMRCDDMHGKDRGNCS